VEQGCGRSGILQKPHEFVDRDAGMADQFSEEAAIQLAVIGDGEVTTVEVIINHVAAGMVIIRKTELGEGPPRLPAGDDR
jgi:hypothetical protein